MLHGCTQLRAWAQHQHSAAQRAAPRPHLDLLQLAQRRPNAAPLLTQQLQRLQLHARLADADHLGRSRWCNAQQVVMGAGDPASAGHACKKLQLLPAAQACEH